MNKLEFTPNARPTLGVEIELGLADQKTGELRSAISDVLGALPPDLTGSVKPELMQCYLEVNTGVCSSVAQAREDLAAKLRTVQRAADSQGIDLLWSATHPFSLWRDQQVTPTERYQGLVNLLQDTARQLITFGLHVHVGVETGDRAIALCDHLLPYLPVLLALSANSPCWDGRITGLQSARSKVMEGLPTAGLPMQMRNWSEYTWLVNHLIQTGFINTIREIWWDVRPHHNFGTVEVRICDVPANLDDTMALVALIQCLVCDLSEKLDEGLYRNEAHPMMVRQNKWRAARYGPQAALVDFNTYATTPVREIVESLVRRLWPTAERLGCQEDLHRVLGLAQSPSSAEKQVRLIREVGPREAVRRLAAASRLPD